ncbi:hypothetical protein Tco_0182677, partial [Tanacetum coccineum]
IETYSPPYDSTSASRHDACVDSTAEADPGNSAPNDSIPAQHGMDEGTNPSVLVDQTKSAGDRVDLSNLLKDTRSAFFTPDSLQDEPIIVSDESEEEKVEKDDTYATSHDVHLLQSQKNKLEQQKATIEAKVASLKARPSYPDINQLTDLLVTSLKPEFSKFLALHDFASCLPTEL